MIFYTALAVWLVTIVFGFSSGGRVWPAFSLLLGGGVFYVYGMGPVSMATFAVLGVVGLIAYKITDVGRRAQG